MRSSVRFGGLLRIMSMAPGARAALVFLVDPRNLSGFQDDEADAWQAN
jgi:hypothetical protein